MNQTHWDDDENQSQLQEQQEQNNEFVNTKESKEALSSVPEEDSALLMPGASSERKKRRGRLVLMMGAALLSLCLIVAAGALGMILGQQLVLTPGDEHSGGLPQFDLTQNSGKTDLDANDGASVDMTHRNPAPTLDKRPSLEYKSYSGSAGDQAYRLLAEAYDQVNETVVEIFTETVVSGGWFGNYVTDGAGSGVIISTDGYIVTNHHVIDGASSVTVRLTDGTTLSAAIVGADESSDIAVLWVQTDRELSAVEMGCSADLIVGEPVFAIGNPLGSLGGTLTDGIISATARQVTIGGASMTLLQTNAAVNPGNSGGGLFNMAGQLIGVVNAKYSQEDVEGLGFAIPIDIAYDVVCQIIEFGYVRGKVDTGLTLYNATTPVTAWKNFDSTRTGLYVVESKYSTELQYGDYLLHVEGKPVTSGATAETLFSGYEVGDRVTLTIIRRENAEEEKTLDVEITLQEYVPITANVRFGGR